MSRSAAGLILAMLSASAMAKWELAYKDEPFDVYVDRNTIQRYGANAKMWVMNNYKEKQTQLGYLSLQMHIEFECQSGRSRPISIAAYAGHVGAGRTIESRTYSEPVWAPNAPGSVRERIWKLVCGKE
jgi:hypothetical protein